MPCVDSGAFGPGVSGMCPSVSKRSLLCPAGSPPPHLELKSSTWRWDPHLKTGNAVSRKIIHVPPRCRFRSLTSRWIIAAMRKAAKSVVCGGVKQLQTEMLRSLWAGAFLGEMIGKKKSRCEKSFCLGLWVQLATKQQFCSGQRCARAGLVGLNAAQTAAVAWKWLWILPPCSYQVMGWENWCVCVCVCKWTKLRQDNLATFRQWTQYLRYNYRNVVQCNFQIAKAVLKKKTSSISVSRLYVLIYL